jgi:hypothetical protein
MKENINIAKILKNKPEKTILYDAMRDINVSLYVVKKQNGETNIFCDGIKKFKGCNFVYSDTGADYIFRKGMQLLKPSKEMQDWEKFSWKKGDVLVSNDGGTEVVFDKWYDETYTSFYCKHYLNSEDENKIVYHEAFLCTTERYSLEDKDSVQTYINTLEKRLGGKLNRETLEIEKPEFKNGDIVTQGVLKGVNVCIIKNCIDKIDNKYNYYAIYNTQDKEIDYDDWSYISPFAKFATDSEKQQLFDALAKEGKAWDAETKTLEDLPKKCEFKPFDKVLVRNTDTEEWFPGFFEKFDSTWNYPYHIMNRRSMTDFAFKQCIPYEGNEHLLGTTKDVEG